MLNKDNLFNAIRIVVMGGCKKIEGEGFKVYSMGDDSPVVRVDIRKEMVKI